jgi:hypothetical protein
MNARFGYHRRLRVQSEFNAIAFLWNFQKMRVRHDVVGVARFLCGRAVPDGDVINRVSGGH